MSDTTLEIPSDYIPGYEKARLIDPALADSYIAHTTIGDPPADELVEALTHLGGREMHRLFTGAMNEDVSVFREGPRELRDFFEMLDDRPSWATMEALEPGRRAFHRNSDLVIQGLVGGSLIEGFSTNIARSFVITGRLREHGVRRLRQNNRHVLEIFLPGGLQRYGDGWKLSVRLRLVHAQVRRLLNDDHDDWYGELWGTPLSAAHMGFAGSAFSGRALRHARHLGVHFSQEESHSFMLVWRYALTLMGIPDALIPKDENEAAKLFQIGKICEPPPDFESIIMANALINAAPQVLGVIGDREKDDLLKLAYTVSRALIGDEIADQLNYPKYKYRAVVLGARLQTRLNYVLDRIFLGRSKDRRLSNFTYLMSASMYDQGGISYRLPDHIYDERAHNW